MHQTPPPQAPHGTGMQAAPCAMAQTPADPRRETHARSLPLLLLHLSACIVLAPALLLALVAALLCARPRRAGGLWYLSRDDQDAIDALPPRALRAVRRMLAVIGWAMAGFRNRGPRAHPRRDGQAESALGPIHGPRAPPSPA